MADERSADEIQREIERSRVALADAVDQLAYRTNPKRVSDNAKRSAKDMAQTTQGRVAISATGALLLVLIIRRVRKH